MKNLLIALLFFPACGQLPTATPTGDKVLKAAAEITATTTQIAGAPEITGLDAPSAVSGTTLTITGKNLGDPSITVRFGGNVVAPLSFADEKITVVVPDLRAGTYPLTVGVGKAVSKPRDFLILLAVTGFLDVSAPANREPSDNAVIRIDGSGFGDEQGDAKFQCGLNPESTGFDAPKDVPPTSWAPTAITFTLKGSSLPGGCSYGTLFVIVKVNRQTDMVSFVFR